MLLCYYNLEIIQAIAIDFSLQHLFRILVAINVKYFSSIDISIFLTKNSLLSKSLLLLKS